MEDRIKQDKINEVDSYGRSAIFYSTYYNALDSAELLIASDAALYMTDTRHRTPLHYSAMNENSKLIEAIVIAFRSGHHEIIINDQE